MDNPALTFSIALAAGIAAQSVALHLRIPGIVLLLAVGVLLGPDVANLVRPDALGHGLDEIVGLAVAVVLFEGGLNLRWRRLQAEASTIRRLITLGGGITAGGGAIAAVLFMGWDWRPAVLFGAIITVTGPTVITPLLRRVRVKRNLRTILEAEAVLIDPIGAVLAVVILEFVLATTTTSAAASLLGLPIRLGLGAALGAVGGLLLGLVLRSERIVPEGYENIFTLAMVLALFEASNAIVHESGIMAAAAAGLVVGNMRTRVQQELLEFKEQLTVLLVGLLFVLLAADVRVAEVVALGWPGALTVLTLMFIVRPADVAVSAL
ncbi:MAG: cation:proton antiporter, partial [Thermoanaerobaculia bacterium]|nr:cation:proton antiporter [Thermoanaerobaculia bacterium]